MGKIKQLVKSTLSLLPQGKYILFESAPDLSDNTRAVFDEMIRRGLNDKYKMVWLCYDPMRAYPQIKNVVYLPQSGTRNKLMTKYYLARTRLCICCNRYLFAWDKKTPSFYLGHGSAIKDSSDYFRPERDFDYALVASECFSDIFSRLYSIRKEKTVALGYPRNDVLSMPPVDLHYFFPEYVFKKVIVWYPTFRQHKCGLVAGGEHALPIIWDKNRALELNDYARSCDVLVVLKPHFAQDVVKIIQQKLSNIVFIDDSFFRDSGLTSYRFMGSCDALLTDYSSVYYDYTLCDKPIGLVWEDYSEYKSNPGFLVDMDKMMKGGEKIFSIEDLKTFVHLVATEQDRLRPERQEIRDLTNVSTDGKNSERVVDFLIKTFSL